MIDKSPDILLYIRTFYLGTHLGLFDNVLMHQEFDVIIIGGGPIGLACGIEAQRNGLKYLILEKGCLVNSLYNYPVNMTFFSTAEKLEIGDVPFVSNNPKPSRAEALEYYRRVASSSNLKLHLFEIVIGIIKKETIYTVATNKTSYNARHIIIATGFYDIPVRLDVPGEDLPKVTHYYKDPHFYAGQNVVVVGSNNSAVDAALETYRKGARVTMVIRDSEVGKRVKYWVKPDIENRIKEGSIRAFFNSNVISIHERSVDIFTNGGIMNIDNDFVIAMTGYKPDFSLLKMAGIQLSGDDMSIPCYNSETMETNQENIFLAGVVCGGMNTHVWFIENSRIHAEKIINQIKGK